MERKYQKKSFWKELGIFHKSMGIKLYEMADGVGSGQVFYHDIKSDNEGNSNVAIVNENFNNGNSIGTY